mmetsp:Transcript_81372/g.225322  ORF Transcript_81372/g.225322 Transcript_81372/m.225322 type:complete len:297 (+) Transcript_81372:1155-2045(+)
MDPLDGLSSVSVEAPSVQAPEAVVLATLAELALLGLSLRPCSLGFEGQRGSSSLPSSSETLGEGGEGNAGERGGRKPSGEDLLGAGSARPFPPKVTWMSQESTLWSFQSSVCLFSPGSQVVCPSALTHTSFQATSPACGTGSLADPLQSGKAVGEVERRRPLCGSQLPSASPPPTTTMVSPGKVPEHVARQAMSMIGGSAAVADLRGDISKIWRPPGDMSSRGTAEAAATMACPKCAKSNSTARPMSFGSNAVGNDRLGPSSHMTLPPGPTTTNLYSTASSLRTPEGISTAPDHIG